MYNDLPRSLVSGIKTLKECMWEDLSATRINRVAAIVKVKYY